LLMKVTKNICSGYETAGLSAAAMETSQGSMHVAPSWQSPSHSALPYPRWTMTSHSSISSRLPSLDYGSRLAAAANWKLLKAANTGPMPHPCPPVAAFKHVLRYAERVEGLKVQYTHDLNVVICPAFSSNQKS
jgi:hypothetical protein